MMSESAANSKRVPMLGCIADDVTGATDLAINLVQGGMCVVQLLDVPTEAELRAINADAVVVAMKTRSCTKEEAISQSVAALDALRSVGIQKVFFKYCSTFDSTEHGNIGPVAEALLDAMNVEQTIFCPAFPRNGRTVYHGHLFVHGKLLNESGMESHPLNPMTDANLVRFLGKQSDRQVGLLSYDDLADGMSATKQLSSLADEGCQFVVADACDDQHLKTLAKAVADQRLVTGGSGIARYLPDAYRAAGLFSAEEYAPTLPDVTGRSLIVAGSCSSATNKQVAWMKSKCEAWQLDVHAILRDPTEVLRQFVDWANSVDPAKTIMIYSSAQPTEVRQLQEQHGREKVAAAIEEFMATSAVEMVDRLDVRKLVLAGGETSGAVVQQLGVRALRIGPEICAGVPWTESLGERRLALALKSGNFGDEDFFEQALEMLS